MDIRQLSIHYHIEQDRIMIRVNSSAGDEVRMWLTRRMAQRLWPLINQIVTDHFSVHSGSGSHPAESTAEADFDTPYHDDATHRPLGNEPLLVTEINLTPKADGVMHMHFRELLEDPVSTPGFQLDMPADMVFAVVQLLGKALEQAEWNLLPGTAPATVAVAQTSPDEIDFAPDAPRPTYLN